MIQRRNKSGLSLVCIAFPGQSLSFILALSSMTSQALLGCSKINKASLRALGKIFFSAIPEACCLAFPPGSLLALICAAFELPGQVTLHRSPPSLCPKTAAAAPQAGAGRVRQPAAMLLGPVFKQEKKKQSVCLPASQTSNMTFHEH